MAKRQETEDTSTVCGISLLSEPPMCEICDRYVKKVSKRTIGPGPFCCRDCYRQWFEGESTKEYIKECVLKKHGELGGEAVGWPKHEIPRLRRKTAIQEEIIQALVSKLREINSVISKLNEQGD